MRQALFTIVSAVAQLERELIRERVSAGICSVVEVFVCDNHSSLTKSRANLARDSLGEPFEDFCLRWGRLHLLFFSSCLCRRVEPLDQRGREFVKHAIREVSCPKQQFLENFLAADLTIVAAGNLEAERTCRTISTPKDVFRLHVDCNHWALR